MKLILNCTRAHCDYVFVTLRGKVLNEVRHDSRGVLEVYMMGGGGGGGGVQPIFLG